MLLEKIKDKIKNAALIGDGAVDVIGLEYDSRLIKDNMLFVAVNGYKLDGNKFIPDAIKNGASAIMTESDNIETELPIIKVDDIRQAMSDAAALFYGYPGNELKCIGVTGTNGKSSSVYLIKLILKASGNKTGYLNSLVYDVGSAKFKADRTTPESPLVQKYLRGMIQSGCQYGIVEVSSHALILKRAENIDFKIGLFTNFSRDHLDFHETMEKYLEAKKILLTKLSGSTKTAVLNLDVPEFAGMVPEAQANDSKVVTYSARGENADISASDIELSPEQSEFKLKIGSDIGAVKFSLPGRYNVSNACGAAATAYAAGISAEKIIEGLESAKPVPGRFVPVSHGQPFGLIIDYAHTPDAIVRLCQSARELTKGKLMILFGCGGDRDKGKRPLMGQAATEYADFAILTSDNPRTEDQQSIIDDVIPGIKKNNYETIIDRVEAIRTIVNRAEKDDTLLIAGKGAEDYQEIGATKHPFSDMDEVIKALENRGFSG